MKKLGLCVLILPAILVVQGCSGSKPGAKLTGKITYKGNPVNIGELSVVGGEDNKQAAIGKVNGDGTYTVDKAPIGKIKISFKVPQIPGGGDMAKDKIPPEMKDKTKEMTPKDKLGGLGETKTYTEEEKKHILSMADMNEKYRNWQSSDLSFTVEAGKDNTYDIELKAK